MHDMPGMAMPSSTKPLKKKAIPAPKKRSPAAKPKVGVPASSAMNAMPGMDHSAMDHSVPSQAPGPVAPTEHMDHGAMPGMAMAAPGEMQPVGTALPAGTAPPPPAPMDHYADRQFPPDEMARSRRQMMAEQGGQTLYQVMFNLAEAQMRRGADGYRWDGEAWLGGDINRLALKSEGEGVFRAGIERAEVQALYSRAVGPYFNLQAGLRHDFEPGRPRTYATIGFEGLAPYWFDIEGALFLSDRGDLLARLEGYYDQRVTQRLTLQPRVELNFAAQNVPDARVGAGLVDAEMGLRLRYEISRRFAPYLGVSHEARTGRSARLARANGEDAAATSLVAGARIWF